MVKVGIIGASYGGGELLRILHGHPEAEVVYFASETFKGQGLGSVYPNMRGFTDLVCEAYDAQALIERCDAVFMAQHQGWAMKEVGIYLDAGVKVIDLSADFRLRDTDIYEQWYKLSHTSPELIGRAVYGLPELYRDKIAGANLVANPGCYVTSAILALMPLLKNGLIDPDSIVVDSKSGVSGAGRSSFKLDYHYPEMNENMKAYNIGVHRHTPEIEQELSVLAGSPVTISFTPHLIPITRGILTTAYAKLTESGKSTEDILAVYNEAYGSEPFVIMMAPGEYPSVKATQGSNTCHIGLKVDPRTNRVVVSSALDNLVRGMSGMAIQNMNLMFGLGETTGLMGPGVYP
ncbi:MAG: N-acetyl-gamma-glutamyl-phosphate reductase [Armatimonadota bacterium]